MHIHTTHIYHKHTHMHTHSIVWKITLPMLYLSQLITHSHRHTHTHIYHKHTHIKTQTLYRLEITPYPTQCPMLHPSQCPTLPNAPPLPMLYPPNAPPSPMLHPSQCSTPPNALPSYPCNAPPSNKKGTKSNEENYKYSTLLMLPPPNMLLFLPNVPPSSQCSPSLLKKKIIKIK